MDLLSHYTWLDYALVGIVILYAFEGYHAGFLSSFFDFVSFIVSFIVGLKFYGIMGSIITSYILIPSGFANAIGFFIVAILSEMVIGMFLHAMRSRVLSESGELNKIFGVIPGVLSALVLLSFILTVVVALPFSPFLKQTVSSSKIANLLIANTQGVEQSLKSVFGQTIEETLNFLTIKPQSQESVSLHFTVVGGKEDAISEQEMLTLVNKQRASRGLLTLTFDSRLADVGRNHSRDMFERGYFSHYTPEGLTPFDRMAKANIIYTVAGENLALAPNASIAMQGLMKSEGHKANILSPGFRKAGIGVIDGGMYGKMFTQEFSD